MLRRLVRDWAAPALYSGGAIAAARSVRRALGGEARLLILLYHRVHDPDAPTFRYQSETLAVSPGHFEQQMAYLSRRYRVLPLDVALRGLDDGSLARGATIAVTFDDGYNDNVATALPILARHGLSATIFLATDFIGTARLPWFERLAVHMAQIDLAAFRGRLDLPLPADVDQLTTAYTRAPDAERKTLINTLCEALKRLPNEARDRIIAAMAPDGADDADEHRGLMLDWDGARRLAEAGCGIGSHSCSHPILSRLPRLAVARELADSKRQIEERLGRACILFAYPNGRPEDWPEEASAQIQAAGYAAACSTVPGVNRASTDRSLLHRVSIGDYPIALFALIVEFWLWRGVRA